MYKKGQIVVQGYNLPSGPSGCVSAGMSVHGIEYFPDVHVADQGDFATLTLHDCPACRTLLWAPDRPKEEEEHDYATEVTLYFENVGNIRLFLQTALKVIEELQGESNA